MEIHDGKLDDPREERDVILLGFLHVADVADQVVKVYLLDVCVLVRSEWQEVERSRSLVRSPSLSFHPHH